MKKLTSYIILVLVPLNVFANQAVPQDKNKDFFYKLQIGSMFMKNATVGGKQLDFFRTSFGNLAPSFGIGFGYYLRDTIRFDVTLNHVTNLTMKTKTANTNDTHKTVFNNIMLNTYLRIFETKATTVFFGIGAGITNINERITVLDQATKSKATYTSKQKNSLSYALSINVDIPLTDDISCEVGYSWKEFGKSKAITGKDGKKLGATPYKGHGFDIAFRFNL